MSDTWAWTVETTLPSRRGAHLPLMEEILARLAQLGWGGRDFFGVQMAIEESLTNAIRHGNGCDETKVVLVSCKLAAHAFYLRVEDQGRGFRPEKVSDCTSEEGLAATGGRGMKLIEAYMTTVEHNDRGNCITMTKTRDGQATADA